MIGRRWWTPWMWMTPALALVSVFLVYPSLDTLRRSLLDERSKAFVGLDNYRFIVENPQPLVADTHQALLTNALWLVVFTGLTVPFGLLLAVLTGRLRYEAASKSAIFIPMAVSFVAASVIWRFMLDFNPDIGTFNAIVTRVGGDPVAWLQDTGLGPVGGIGPLQLNNLMLMLIGVWMWTGFALVVLSAGLKGISSEVIEAARVDGATERQILFRIIIPILRPTIIVVTTTLLIYAMKIFDLVWVTTGGRFGTDVVSTLFFKQAFINRDFGVGAALAFILLAAVVPLMAISVRRFQAEEERA